MQATPLHAILKMQDSNREPNHKIHQSCNLPLEGTNLTKGDSTRDTSITREKEIPFEEKERKHNL